MTSYQRFKVVRNETNNHVAEVIFNTPNNFNAMDSVFFAELGTIFRQLDKEEDVYVILIWGEGKVFSSGLDLKKAAPLLLSHDENESPAMQNLKFMKMLKLWQNNVTAIEKCKKPVIAACHGAVIGAAIDLITACDIRLCTKDAKFSVRETKVGIVADVGTLQRITPIVGKGFAREMAYTGDDYDADRALHFHLVNAVYDNKDLLLEGARKMASNIAQNSPLIVQGTKHVLQYAEEHSIEDSKYIHIN